MVKWGIVEKQRQMSDARGEGFVSRRSRKEAGRQADKISDIHAGVGNTSGVARVND